MQVRLPKKYLKGIEKVGTPYPVCIIMPPENIPELSGYVLKILQEHITITNSSILINKGKWNKQKKQEICVFEREVKDPAKRSKRYSYTAAELKRLYSNALYPNYREWLSRRTKIIENGSGKLVRASFIGTSRRMGAESKIGWFVLPDMDERWAYPIDYDPVLDIGRIDRGVPGFSIYDSYFVSDISVLREHNNELVKLLSELDHIRQLQLNSRHNLQRFYVGEDGTFHIADSMGAALAVTCYETIPDETTHGKKRGAYLRYETQSGRRLRMELMRLGLEMERKCREYLCNYQKAETERIALKIKMLIGINVVV